MNFTEKEINSISFAYSCVYYGYKKVKRSREDDETKRIKMKIWIEHLLTLQSIIKDKLNIDCTFKEL